MKRISFLMFIVLSIFLSDTVLSQNRIPVIPEVTKEDQICFAMYTVQNNIMRMSAQLYPLDDDDDRFVRLEINKEGTWIEIDRERINENSYNSVDDARAWNVLFRVESWNSKNDVDYRVAHGEKAFFYGKIRKDPIDKETIVVAAFTGNSNKDRTLRPDLIANLKAQDPDLLFFSGDQS
ncbi:MAG: hypothetical protein KAS71_14540, partial [Bacteroidales bacterium]|nr:hypothetical protein [Bacteroidales bacterium]